MSCRVECLASIRRKKKDHLRNTSATSIPFDLMLLILFKTTFCSLNRYRSLRSKRANSHPVGSASAAGSLLITATKRQWLMGCQAGAFVSRWAPGFDLMASNHAEWIQMTGLTRRSSSSIHIFLWLKRPPRARRFLWCFFFLKSKKKGKRNV